MSDTSNNPPEDKNITLPISRFLEYAIGSADKRYRFHPDDAIVLSLKDGDETFCHVEFPSNENKLDAPCVWKIKEWRTAYEKLQRDKARYTKERQAANIFRENVELVISYIVKHTGLERDRVRPTAINIVRRGKKEELMKLGITIEEWDRTFNLGYIQ